jgi:hypothetical protein
VEDVSVDSGLYNVDELDSWGWVPVAPTSTGQNVFLWPGIGLPNGDILQPLLNYTNNDCTGGGYCWTINAFYFPVSSGRMVYSSSAYEVSPGDEIELYSIIVGTITGGVEWVLVAQDYTSPNQNQAITYVDEPAPSGQWDYVEGNVTEAYFSNCDQLPASTYSVFFDQNVYTANPYWDSYDNVSQSQTWNVTDDGASPSCGTSGGDYNEGASYGWETWTEWDNCNSTTSCP